MSRRILAIDIHAYHLSALLLATGLKTMVVESFALVKLEKDDEDGTGQQAIAAALNKLKAQIDTANAGVVVGLPAGSSYYRSAILPFKDEKRIRQVLGFELEPGLPLPVDQLAFDFLLTPQGEGARILATAVDRQYLDAILNTLSDAALEPQTIVPGGFALSSAFSIHGNQLPEQYLLMDMDGEEGALFAIDGGHTLTIRSIPLDTAGPAANPAWTQKIRQTLSAFDDAALFQYNPDTLFLTGSVDLDQQAADAVGKALSMKVSFIDLQKMDHRIEISPSASPWQPMLSDGALALALVEAENGPCPSYHRTGSALHSLWDAYKPFLKGTISLLAAMVILFFVSLIWDIHLLQQRVDRINEKIAAVITSAFPLISQVGGRPVDLMRSKLEEYKKSQVDFPISGTMPQAIDILEQISELIPKEVDVRLNRLNISGDAVTLSGETIDYNTVEDIKSRLEKSELFKTVSITNSDRDKSGTKVRFRLKIDL